MTQTAFFGADDPLPAASLPSTSTDLSWHNVQRQRLRKFARQYLVLPPIPVETLRSQGEPDITRPEVTASRDGFTQLRRDLPVIDQYFEYSGDTAFLSKARELCLAWTRVNRPDGKPVNETNFEWLVRVIARRRDDFAAGEWTTVTDWLRRLRDAKEGFDFATSENEGAVAHGNWYTHHYKVLLQVYRALDDAAGVHSVTGRLVAFATRNFPYGNAAVTHPTSHAIVGTSASGRRFDVSGDRRGAFPAGASIRVAGSSTGCDGVYTVASTQYLASSGKTRLFTVEAVPADGGGGALSEPSDGSHDMPRAAVAAGESIDYVRRDALHYQVYDLAPWIEIGLMAGGFDATIDAAWDFFVSKLTSARKHYEFAASSDPFDTVRWQSSHPEYLAPQAMFKPNRAAGTMFAYFHARNRRDPEWREPANLVAVALRATDTLASFWPSYFRWALGYG